MALVQIKAVTIINAADEHGSLKTYYPGDWLKVGKQKAIELLESGQAEIPQAAEAQRALTDDLSDCGVYLREGDVKETKAQLGGLKLDIVESSGALRLPFERTLIWHGRQPLQRRQIALGFARIEDTGRYDSWEVAAMLRSGDLLALTIGDQAEQRKTREAIGDLRLPVYETSAVWVRKTAATEAMVRAWDREMQDSDCEEHAFLRALYLNRVLLCSLPAGWLARWIQ
jgi:hypothetical protein